MKKLVWVFGLLLLLSFVFPDGLPGLSSPEDNNVVPVVPEGPTDSAIVALLSKADATDRARIVSVYTGLETVLKRDNGKLVTNTEKLALVQANTLATAIETPGKYPGLDKEIERVFLEAVGTDDVVPVTPELVNKLAAACALIINSAK